MKYTVALLVIALLTCGCYRPMVKYIQYDPSAPFIMNTWYKFDDTYWFSTPSIDLAEKEYQRVTGHAPDTIPQSMYGFHLWGDGVGMYYVTQTKRIK